MNIGVTISALCMGAAGLLLLFAPRETGVALGGIYGRAVVVGNLMHLLGGAFVLIGKVSQATPAFMVLTGLYVIGAALFVYLTYFSTGLRKSASRPV